MNPGTIIGNTLRGLLHPFRPSNLLYILLATALLTLAATLHLGHLTTHIYYESATPQPLYPLPRLLPAPTTIAICLAALLLLLAKNLDNATRLYNGHRRGSFALLRDTDLNQLIQYLTGLALWGVLLSAAPFICANLDVDERITWYADRGAALLAYLLAPAITLAYIDGSGTESMLDTSALYSAVADIGFFRYLLLLALIALLITGFSYAETYLWQQYTLAQIMTAIEQLSLQEHYNYRRLPPNYYLYTGLMSALLAWLITATYSLAAWNYPRDEEDDEAEEDIAPLAATETTPLTTTAPVTAADTENQPDTAPATDDGAVEATEETAADTAAADDTDPQETFAHDLARADDYLRQGDIKTGIALLKHYTDADHDPITYFPAYQRHYALQPDGDLLRRIAQAAARGDEACYDLIQPELEQIDPSELLAGSIRPLAQIAARRQQYRTVANLTRDFAAKYPAHPHLVDNQYLAALAHAHSGETEQALPLLEELYTHYPQHNRAPQIARLIEELKTSLPINPKETAP